MTQAGGLTIRDLSYRYSAHGPDALSEVSFSVAPGRFCALLGANGAGKSTLFNLVTRLFTTPHGVIEVAGHDIRRAPRKALARMGVVFQQPTLDLDLSVRRNLSYFAALHGLSGHAAASRIDAALDRFGLTDRAEQPARALSGGYRRRVEIARSTLHSPAVLLLDEPTVGLDPQTRAALTDDVHAMCTDDGLTVLWSTHLLDEVRETDRLVMLEKGRVTYDGIGLPENAKAPA
mgnify:CR=1 FL=1